MSAGRVGGQPGEQAEGLEIERRERFKLGLIEWFAACKPAPG
jgi:hypothetical protein